MKGFQSPMAASLAASCLFVLAIPAHAQVGFNIDLDESFAPPELGGGAPSSAFGAAAYQPGFWNAIAASGNPTLQLHGLAGQLTNVTITGPAGGSGGGDNFPGNTGDYALLLNDGNLVGSTNSWMFAGVPSGDYDVYVYAVNPSNRTNPTAVHVTGAPVAYVNGPMPGNQFILGQTHCIEEISVTSGTFTISVDRGSNFSSYVNGFQIVPVPEPATLAGLGIGLLALTRRRKVAST